MEQPSHPPRQDFPNHDDGDDGENDGEHEIVVEALESCEQRRADAAAADQADQRGIAQVGIELVGAKTDQPRHHLRRHRHDDAEGAERRLGNLQKERRRQIALTAESAKIRLLFAQNSVATLISKILRLKTKP